MTQPPMAPPPQGYAPPPQSPPPQVPVPQGYVPPLYQPGPAPGIRYSGNGVRFVSYLVDGFIAALIGMVFFIAVGTIAGLLASVLGDTGAVIGLVAAYVAVLVFAFCYYPFFWSRSGQTPGKRMLRLKVVSADDGTTISFGRGLLRMLGYIVNSIIFGIPIGFAWVLFDQRRQGWHDKIANTVVIEVP